MLGTVHDEMSYEMEDTMAKVLRENGIGQGFLERLGI